MQTKKCRCYDKWWLRKDMDNMGYIFEYCQKYCHELFGEKIDKLKFLIEFMNSECRAAMESGDPRLLSQAAYDTVKDFIEYECNGSIEEFISDNKSEQTFRFNQLLWAGRMYAYIHFKTELPGKEIIRIIPIDGMLDEYYTGHEMDTAAYYSRIQHLFVLR